MEYYNTALQYYSTVQYLEKSYATHAATNCPVTPPIRFFSFFILIHLGSKKIQKIALDGKVTYPRDGQAQGSLRTPLFDAK